MSRPAPVRLDADTWVIMRSAKDHPTAIVNRVTDLQGTARFLVLKWNLDPAKRRMTGIFPTLEQADASVLYDNSATIAAAQRATSGPPNGGGSLHSMPANARNAPSRPGG